MILARRRTNTRRLPKIVFRTSGEALILAPLT
jgi:hypothetical protein